MWGGGRSNKVLVMVCTNLANLGCHSIYSVLASFFPQEARAKGMSDEGVGAMTWPHSNGSPAIRKAKASLAMLLLHLLTPHALHRRPTSRPTGRLGVCHLRRSDLHLQPVCRTADVDPRKGV